MLVTVNAGSNDITSFLVTDDGLQAVDRVSSGGVRPNSVDIRGDLAYVLNAGGTPNVSGFHVGIDGSLTPIGPAARLSLRIDAVDRT